jgi:hypothetical protein
MVTETIGAKRITRFEFTDRGNALSFADRCLKMQMVILGDNERFWVVSMADGEYLIRNGYEAAL